jgi:hypothetical protein
LRWSRIKATEEKMLAIENPLDVWNVGSFDSALIALLES